MKRLFIAAAGLLLAFALTAGAQSAAPETSAALESTAPYRVGEKLTYNVSFSNFPNAAYVELLVADIGKFYDRDAVVLRARVATTEIVSAALFSLNNDYTTYVSPENGQPFRVQQVARTGDIISQEQDAEYSAGEFDFLSALYRFRAMPLADKAVYSLPVNEGETRYRAQLRVLGRGTVKTSLGSFRVITTEILPEGRKNTTYRPRIFFTDDERHIPVVITMRHSNGEIRADLVGSEMLKRPIPAGSATMPDTADDSDDRPGRNIGQPQTVPTSLPRGNNASLGTLPFELGEKLNYNVYFTRIKEPVGAVTYEVRERAKLPTLNKDLLLLSARAETTAALRSLFTAKDNVTSYVDQFTLLPERTLLNLQEGRRKVDQQLNWDQERGLVAILNGPRLEVPLGTHDYLSFFYALRSYSLTPPPPNSKTKAKKTAAVLLVNNRPMVLSLEPVRMEKIELDGQEVEATLINLTTDDPTGPDRFVLRLWVSNDRRRLPLRLTATLPQGVVRADLLIKPAR